MHKWSGPVEILKMLEKNNCRDCGEKTCLAFAAAVFNGHKALGECPRLDADIVDRFGGNAKPEQNKSQDADDVLAGLKHRISKIDLSAASKRLRADYDHDKITVSVLGKDFSVNSQGDASTLIHVHSWVTVPVFSYIINGAGTSPKGEWVHLRELPNGETWARFFEHRCEKPLKKLADAHPDLLSDVLRLFSGSMAEDYFDADISLVLDPIPNTPMLICYWKPEDGMESSLNIFFDSTAEENLSIDAIYILTAGLVVMFEKIAQTHGFGA